MVFAQFSLLLAPGEHVEGLTKSAKAKAALVDRCRHIERYAPVGELCARFVLPLELCPRYNDLLRRHFGAKSTLGRKVITSLQSQGASPVPLSGRPLVRFVRFSTRAPDRDSSWTKVPLDALVKTGMIADDNDNAINLRAWWEPATLKTQCVYLDIWTGA